MRAGNHGEGRGKEEEGIRRKIRQKDHSKDNKPDFNAAFGKFGSALIISLHEDGDIYGCEVVHSAHQKQGFSSIGSIEMSAFTDDEGKVCNGDPMVSCDNGMCRTHC